MKRRKGWLLVCLAAWLVSASCLGTALPPELTSQFFRIGCPGGGRAGLQKNDLIQGVNASKVSTVQELTTAYGAVGRGPIEVRFVRGQKLQSLRLRPNNE